MRKMNGHKAQFVAPTKLFLIHKSGLAKEWPFLQEQLLSDPELWNTQYTLDELRERLEDEESQLWVARAGKVRIFWFLTDVWIRAGDERRVLQVWWMRGERLLENIALIADVLCELTEKQAYHSVVVSGRKAWERVLAPHGFKLRRVELVRELETRK